MPSLRDIVLARSKEPAKIHPVVRLVEPRAARGVDSPVQSPRGELAPRIRQTPQSPQAEETLVSPCHLQRRRLTPQSLVKPGEAGRRCGGQPSKDVASPSKPSERRRPQPKDVPLPRLGLPTRDHVGEHARDENVDSRSACDVDAVEANADCPKNARQRAPAAVACRGGLGRAAVPSGARGLPTVVEQRELGRVPKYLEKRKVELAEAKRIAERPLSPQPPPGYRRVKEEERSATLKLLQSRKSEVEKAHAGLPFKIETPGQRRREKNIDDRLKHIDRLLAMFGQALVFIPADAEPIA